VRSQTASCLRPGQDGDGLGEFGVGGQRPVGGHVGAQDVGQHERVAGVGFLARYRVPIAIARYRHRVDRIDFPSGGAQAGDQQATAGLDGHRDGIISTVAGVGEQGDQGGEAGCVVADPPLSNQCSLTVDQGEVVVGLGPVDATKHLQDRVPPVDRRDLIPGSKPGPGHARSLMAGLQGPTSHQRFVTPAHRQGPRSAAELASSPGDQR
jgi:hypothetical protein